VSSNSPTGQKDVSITGPINSEGATPTSSETESETSTRSPTLQPTGTETGTETEGSGEGSGEGSEEGGHGTKAVDIRVTGNRVEPPASRVEVNAGEPLRLTVTSDVDNELHIHGVNITRTVRAGQPLTVEFVTQQAGTYEVELHNPELLLLKYVAR
jgi:hypothetical protein